MWQNACSSFTNFIHFYSHIPCGMWRFSCKWFYHNVWFLLTHPVWDVTISHLLSFYFNFISTHTSRVGCDHNTLIDSIAKNQFLLTHPVWDVTSYTAWKNQKWNFYSHIPCGMWHKTATNKQNTTNFYSHIPCGMWHINNTTESVLENFYSHIPCGMWPRTAESQYNSDNFYSHIPCGMWLTVCYLFCHCDNFYSHIPCGMWRN